MGMSVLRLIFIVVVMQESSVFAELSMWTYMRHVSSSVVLIGVACYGAYYLYKVCFVLRA